MAKPNESVAVVRKVGNALYVNLNLGVLATLGVKKGDVVALAHGNGYVKITKVPLREAFERMEASKTAARELAAS